MNKLRLYNTLTRKKEDFVPLDPQNVRMYVCGPTVYDFAHIGNARPAIVFDVLFRLLRHHYGENHVNYVRNITDVDDKINARAQEIAKERNIPVLDAIRELTEKTAKQYDDDVTALGCLKPTFEPRATEHIKQMIALIERLVAAKHAYVAEGHVLYDVSSKSDYGKLSRRPLDEMIAGARVEVAPYKKNPMDFVLWKPSTPDLPGWDSPWSFGRPGWHIECSAMSEAYLGETFDIHGGGIDLLFPHHENEIAQSEGAHPHSHFARVWMHNGFLQVEGEKMAKSLGNFITIRDLLNGWKNYSWPGEALRLNMLKTHYREPFDWTLDSLDESHKVLWEWYRIFESEKVTPTRIANSVIDELCDDLNTPKMITEFHALKKKGELGSLLATLQLLGFSGQLAKITRHHVLEAETGRFTLTGYPAEVSVSENANVRDESDATIQQKPFETLGSHHEGIPLPLFDASVREQIAARNVARKAKNFKEADRIRAELESKGIILKDNSDGTTNWEVKR